jgi:pyroglutamyl-peptidase
MRTVLLTGFEPFDGELCNPSWDAAKRFDGLRLAGASIHVQRLPVEFAGAIAVLAPRIYQLLPDLVIAIGQAGGSNTIALERVALNFVDPRIADNAGQKPVLGKLDDAAPAAYFSNFPISSALIALNAANIPAQASLSAGAFVCNALYFQLCQLRDQQYPRMQTLFMHIPYAPVQICGKNSGAPCMPIDQIEAAIRILVALANK